jgi:acyl-CoA reductase-like NAD-dependent aldehyde dehydrogenase
VGNWFVESREVAHVSFTGSVDVGKRIWETSAETLKPVTLELGGNDAAIVLADADVDQIIEPLFWGAFTNAGQFCTGIKRIYVQDSLYEQVVGKLCHLARETTVGDGIKSKTQMGPLTHQAQFDRIIELVEQTKQRGATIAAGGEPLPGPGFFYPPTIITDVTEGDPIVAEEQFGPVLPILSFRDVGDAIERANSTNFGLGGSVWTKDEKLASQIAGGLECGTVWINQHGALDPLVPFGGHKQSGIGCENGWAGVSEFTKMKVVSRSLPASPKNSSR